METCGGINRFLGYAVGLGRLLRSEKRIQPPPPHAAEKGTKQRTTTQTGGRPPALRGLGAPGSAEGDGAPRRRLGPRSGILTAPRAWDVREALGARIRVSFHVDGGRLGSGYAAAARPSPGAPRAASEPKRGERRHGCPRPTPGKPSGGLSRSRGGRCSQDAFGRRRGPAGRGCDRPKGPRRCQEGACRHLHGVVRPREQTQSISLPRPPHP